MRVEIEKIATKVLERAWDRKLPVCVDQIIKNLGANIEEIYLDGLSGKVIFDDGGMCLLINRKDSIYRKRYTVAYLLGHLCLGHSSKIRGESYEVCMEPTDEADEANIFAASLLMPRPLIIHAMEELAMKTYAALAEYFKVSLIAAEMRLKHLQLNF